MLTPIERVYTAAKLGEPDYVPAIIWGSDEAAAYLSKLKLREYYMNKKIQLNTQIAFQKRFHDVVWWMGIRPDLGLFLMPTVFGGELEWPSDGPPWIKDMYRPKTKIPDDVDTLELPEIKRSGIFPRYFEYLEYMYKNTPKELKEKYGHLEGNVQVQGPVEVAMDTVGYTQFLVGLYRYPDAIHKLLRIMTKAVMEWIRMQQEIVGKTRLFLMFDHMIQYLTIQQVKKFHLPYVKTIFDAVRSSDACLVFHGLEHPKIPLSHLELATDFNIDIIMTGLMNLGEAKRKVGGRTCLMGNLDPIKVFLEGEPNDVKEACKKAILEAAHGGGFILSNTGVLAKDVFQKKVKNVDAMIEASREYGRYPIAITN